MHNKPTNRAPTHQLSHWMTCAESPHLTVGWTEDQWVVRSVYNHIREQHAANYPWLVDACGYDQRMYEKTLNI